MEFVQGPTALNFVCLASASALLCPLVNEWGSGWGQGGALGIRTPGPHCCTKWGICLFPILASEDLPRWPGALRSSSGGWGTGRRVEAYLQGMRDVLQRTAVQKLGATSFLPHPPSGGPWGPSESRGSRSIHPFICHSLTHSLLGQENTQVSKTGPVPVLRELLEGKE